MSAPKTFYVLARPHGQGWTYLTGKYRSVPKLICGLLGDPNALFPDSDEVLLRVTEIQEPPRRELVTEGDLSLLDGPCVVEHRGTFLGEYDHGRGTCWVLSLNEAQVFKNQGAPLKGYNARIIPIREVPGRTTYKEEVLA